MLRSRPTPLLLSLSLGLAACALACSDRNRDPVDQMVGRTENAPGVPQTDDTERDVEVTTNDGPRCETLAATLFEPITAAVESGRACRFSHECVEVALSTSCGSRAPAAVHAAHVGAVEAAIASTEGPCTTFVDAECPVTEAVPRMDRAPACREGVCLLVSEEERDELWNADVPIADANRASLVEAPPRPPPGDATERARRLFDAIVRDDPRRATDFFFPREAFLELKGMEAAGRYWDRLFARYQEDIHALHATLDETIDLDKAEFDRLEIVRRGEWVGVGDEGNRLPYWASRHSLLHYRVGDRIRTFEVRVLITWGNDWYITHLSEFH